MGAKLRVQELLVEGDHVLKEAHERDVRHGELPVAIGGALRVANCGRFVPVDPRDWHSRLLGLSLFDDDEMTLGGAQAK